MQIRSFGVPVLATLLLLNAAPALAARFTPGRGPASPIPAQSLGAAVGVPVPILDPSGVKLSVVVNSVQDSPKEIAPSPPGGGRWVVLDVSVTNVGTIPFDLTAGDFQLMSPQTLIYRPDGSPDLPLEQLPETNVLPGQTVEGQVVFALPSGVMTQAVTFQALGTAQWIVALLS